MIVRSTLGVRRPRALLAAVVVCLAASAPPASTQGRLNIRFYHGASGQAEAYETVTNGRVEAIQETEFSRSRPVNSQVCVRVANPHPVLYSYSLTSRVDTVKFVLPEIGKLVSSLQQNSALDLPVGTPAPDSLWYHPYIVSLNTLSDEGAKASRFVNASDNPEAKQELDKPGGQRSGGFLWARDSIRALKGDPGHFNDPNLEKTLQSWYEQAKNRLAVAKANKKAGSADDYLLDVLQTSGKTLLGTVDAIKTAYVKSGTPLVEECVKVASEPMTIALKVQRRDGAASPARAVGDTALKVVIQPVYSRALLEVLPVSYNAFIRNVHKFSVIDGRVTEDIENEFFEVRAGAMLVTNIVGFGGSRAVWLGAGLGSNLLGGDKVFSELFGGVLLSYRESFRVGVGWGQAKAPARLKSPARPNEPLPAGTKLEDVIEKGDRQAYFLVFNLTDLNLPLVKRN